MESNIIIKETKWFNDDEESDEGKQVAIYPIITIVVSPILPDGSDLHFPFDENYLQKAFIFLPDNKLLQCYPEGEFKDSDAHYGNYTIVREYIKTNLPETKHESNGWTKTIKVIWSKGDVSEEIICQ